VTKEAYAIAAAAAGKHVLVDKPFENLASLQRIAAACREYGVGFMDATHFSHHPRTAQIKASLRTEVGAPISLASAFLISMSERDNIRFDPAMEPYGAIGDIGWYCMRAAAEYLDPGIELVSADSRLFRDPATSAAVRGMGLLVFDDGSQSAWEAAFLNGAGIMDLRIAGPRGAIKLDDFALQRPEEGPARYEIRHDWDEAHIEEVTAPRPEAALMFEDFAAMVGDPEAREASIRISERTQHWLDAAWQAALEHEAGA
jgi:predicted dehydrogenase